MIPWLLLAAGMALGIAGVTVGVGAAGANRVELYRWIAGRLRGAAAARTLLAAPGRIRVGASGMATGGALLVGLGLWAILSGLGPILWASLVLLVGVPLFLAAVYSFSRAAGRRWAEHVVRGGVQWVDRLAVIFAPVRPSGTGVRERGEATDLLAKHGVSDPPNSEELTAVSGVLAFTERPVREVITPRTEIVAVREGAPLEEIGRVFVESGYSRIPVYRDSLDNIVGMIYAFDFLKVAPGAELPLRPVTMAPASKPCGDLLFQMQRDRHQLAVTLDEYGGTAGIATFQDLLEELVGGIFETDADPMAVGPTAEVIEVSGTTASADIAKRFGTALPGDAETIGGVLARAAGRIPRAGERFELAGLEFDILSASATVVERVVIRRAFVPVTRLDEGGAG